MTVDFKALDPGIRLTVRWLQEHQFHTTDSGDGRSKSPIENDDILDFPHVFMTCDPRAMVTESVRLRDLLEGRGLDPVGHVEASYSPDDTEIAVIALINVDDDMLLSGVSPNEGKSDE